ncbi:hypothetical protein MPTK1_7g00560 [Marchantia polymorpha subsp. ruderalis]|uniref:ACT domain-containing protein n=2 Tax=Marchantia polymorpha TaxID=3197 RepID=A0AAF6BUS6_MARPO|nr:hypothetical protein MARPO_0046s0069 [Marchantia polymorpha]BBN15760.1 hypothetical protein Mp_7g00560 [Marchantia polymorpha subsp. ruderalis]|eukprot:PTQ39248.1 hypothetical protein MARPO_0046s0069 [Marchantia polymorpha]
MATALLKVSGLVKEAGSIWRERRVVSSAEEHGRALRSVWPAVPAALQFGSGCSSSSSAALVAAKHHGGGGAVGASASLAAVASVVQDESEKEKEAPAVPLPVVHIDQESQADSTVVEISFGDRLGALLDTIKALKNLGLNVVRAKVSTEGDLAKNKFYITRLDNGCKVENPEVLEAIRLTILNNLLKYHPESSEQLALGAFFGSTPPKATLDVDVATHIYCKKVNDKQSMLTVETADRPGLLLEIIKIMADISVEVESAEIDTEGLVAKDKFLVSYGGAALSKSLEQVLVNCLRYFIRRPITEDDSY